MHLEISAYFWQRKHFPEHKENSLQKIVLAKPGHSLSVRTTNAGISSNVTVHFPSFTIRPLKIMSMFQVNFFFEKIRASAKNIYNEK